MLRQLTILEDDHVSDALGQELGNPKEYASNSITNKHNKSRETSFSSIMDPLNNNVRADRLGLRKLAKACSRSFAAWNESGAGSRYSKSNIGTDDQESGSVGMWSFGKSELVHPTLESQSPAVQKLNRRLSSTDWKNIFEAYELKTKRSDSEIANERRTYRKSRHYLRSLDKVNTEVADIEEKIQAIDIKEDFCITAKGRRIVQMKHFPSMIGLKTVLSQVCGGPLEKIVIKNQIEGDNYGETKSKLYQLRHSTLELWFLKSEDAESFMKYSMSGMFLVNGIHFLTEWAPPDPKYPSDMYHETAMPSIMEKMSLNNVRRVLVLKKYIKRAKLAPSTRNYPSPKSHLSELNVDEIAQDFEEYGMILEVTPVISRKLCVSIHYFNVESAIAAKEQFDEKSSQLSRKYTEWTLWYGKDPVDKPCMEI